MTFRRRQFIGWGVLVCAAVLGLGWLARLDYTQKISTDVLDLVPVNEREPQLTLVRQLASEAEARTMLFVLTTASGEPAAPAAATRFAGALAAEPAFDGALAMGELAARDALGAELFAQRFALLFPRWLSEREAVHVAGGGRPADFSAWLARDTAVALERFLSTPEALAFQDLIPADPLLLMPSVVDRLKGGLALVQPASGGTGPIPALVWAKLSASPLSEAGQAPAFAAIERARAVVAAEFPGVTIAYTGINRFAAASRARIEQEVAWLNSLSLVAVIVLALVFIRGVHRGLHFVPVVLLAVLGAWVTATAAFDRLHIMVFVVGSMLTGVAIDYGFYLFMQPPVRPGEDYWDKVRRLAKPLLASCLTTVAGFSLLLFSELPMIRQLGVFVGAGLVSALVAAVVYFSTVANPFLETRTFRGGQALSPGVRRGARRLVVVAWFAALPGLVMLTWRDDIRELEIPSAELKAEDARIRTLFGDGDARTVYLSYGSTLGEARAALARFETWLATVQGAPVQLVGLGAIVPTAAEQTRAVDFVRNAPDFPTTLRAALEDGGFSAAEFTPFFDAYAGQATPAAVGDATAALTALQTKLVGPLGLLLHTGEPLNWFVTLAANAPAASPPTDTDTVSASQLQTLNRVFARYRESALWLSLVGLAIVGLGVLLTYGVRDGLRIFAIPLGACLGVFGLFGWYGQPLNLFHLLGAFLGVCLTHNYSIFSATSAYRSEPPPVSVRLSALTTAASFGVLALSGIPVVRALGLTVGLMVVTAMLLIEFEHLAALTSATSAPRKKP